MDVNGELKFLGKFTKKLGGGGVGRGGQVGGRAGGGGQGGCERRIEVFGRSRAGGGVWVDVNEELKFWENSQKKKFRGKGGRGGG